jgi:O-methyltransferase involved in polyketide biosynthesis
MPVKLNGVAETALIPLWAKASETRSAKPIIQDFKAVELVEQIDYDFDKFKNSRLTQTGVAIRTRLFDSAAEAFITEYPAANIINIGAGLDTRFTRVDNGQIKWFDLDLPEIIAVRSQFFFDTDRCRMIAKSVFDYSWLDEIQDKKAPALLIAEGILMYFTETQIQELLTRLRESFPHSEMLLETISVFMSKNSNQHETLKKTGGRFSWGLNDGSELERLVPGLKYLRQWNYFDYHRERWGIMGLMGRFPPIRKLVSTRIVHISLN